MASTYSNSLRLELIATGEAAATWGEKTNVNLTNIASAFGYATQDGFAANADSTTTVADGAADPARAMYFKVTSSATLTATRTLTIAPNTISRVMWIENATTGGQSIQISQGTGANVTIPTGKTAVVYLDGAGSGAAVVDAMAGVSSGASDTLAEILASGNATGGTDIAVGTGDDITFADSSKAIFGAGSDLQIYHDSSNNIVDSSAATLAIQAPQFVVQDDTGAKNIIWVTQPAASVFDVRLSYDGSTKLATTATGIDVTGTVTADGVTSNGNITLGAGDKLQFNADRYFTPENNIDGAEVSANGVFRIKTGTTPAARLLVSGNGDISFYEDTGTTAKLFWDASAERLGVGTITPNTPVDAQLSGSGGLPVSSGTAQTYGSLRVGATSFNTILDMGTAGASGAWLQASDKTALGTNYSLLLNPNGGNVGIGDNNPLSILHIGGGSDANLPVTFAPSTGGNAEFRNTSSTGTFTFTTNNGSSEAMRISGGNLLVGCTSVPSASVAGFAVRDLNNGWIHTSYDSTNVRSHHIFYNPNGSVGGIQTSGSSTLYNTSSDQRLKDNIVDAPSASDDIDAIQVRSFDWKADGSHQKYGMVAQELIEVAPEAVAAPEDPEEMMGVDYSKLVPMLVKEIQSLRARVAQLES